MKKLYYTAVITLKDKRVIKTTMSHKFKLGYKSFRNEVAEWDRIGLLMFSMSIIGPIKGYRYYISEQQDRYNRKQYNLHKEFN